MLKQNLIEEYNILFRLTQYRRFYEEYCYMCYERNNFNLLTSCIEDFIVDINKDKNFN